MQYSIGFSPGHHRVSLPLTVDAGIGGGSGCITILIKLDQASSFLKLH
jgi:hypothetical protein